MPAPAAAAETPKRGGTLTYMIPADAPPSFDGHRETTYATVHAAAPFYSVLIRVNPDNPSSTTDFVCDLCTEMPKPTDDGKTYTFKIRQGVKFHDGTPLTAADVAASWQEIIHPPEGVSSARESYYVMVDKVEAPDPTTVVFRLKFATSAFLPALADPFTWIYKKEILDKDPHWYEKNIMGSGPFKFAGYEIGQSIKGVRNPDYYHEGPALSRRLHRHLSRPSRRCASMPSAPTARPSSSAACRRRRATSSCRSSATRSSVQEQRLELRQPDHAQPQEEAVRRRPGAPRAGAGDRPVARRAGAGQDRQRADGGRHRLPGLAAGGDQGGAARRWPATGPTSRSRAPRRKRLLKEAGAEGLTFELLNRNVDQPYKFVGTWLIDEWSKIGLHVTQRVVPTGPWFEAMRSGNFDVVVEANCQSMVNPLLDVRQVPAAHGLSPRTTANYEDQKEIELYQTDAARDRRREAARADARVREARARHRRRTRS